MGKHIKKFSTILQYNVYESNLSKPNVSFIDENDKLCYNPMPHDYSKDYLTFVALESGTFTFTGTISNSKTNSLSYSIDDGETWVDLGSGEQSPTINASNTIMWKGSCNPKVVNDANDSGIGTFSSTGRFNAQGNIMSLTYQNFSYMTNLTFNCYFCNLFKECTLLINAKNLILSATTLSHSCYYSLFVNCSNLRSAPSLPATSLTQNCYYNMFKNCSSLTTTPNLPATSLANNCYRSMFEGCTSLSEVKPLKANNLVEGCYYCMFKGCSSLTKAPTLLSKSLANICYSGMFYGCTNLTTVQLELPATTLMPGCYRQMFYGCKNMTIAPNLPATTLANSCYFDMFKNCTSLNNIKCLATDISATDCTTDWVNGVANSGTFTKDANMNDWGSDSNGIPTNWTILDAA